MHLEADDIIRAHEVFGARGDLISQRRAVFAVAVELLSDGAVPEPGTDVLDNPLVRGAISEVLSGVAEFRVDCLRPIGQLVAPGFSTVLGHSEVRLASSPAARTALEGPLSRVADELCRHGDSSWLPTILTGDDVGTAEAWATLVDGVRLAQCVAPSLTGDLLPHVVLFAVVRSDTSDRLGSASAREYPGLILLPEPTSSLEVAEALIHEGAHQKFFDLALSNTLLPPPSQSAPRFVPSWAAPGAPHWPLEQAFAACHAYVCLSVLADAARSEIEAGLAIHPHSLLPHAARRAAEIGVWLLGQEEWVHGQGRHLVQLLLGRQPGDESSVPTASQTELVSLTGTEVIRRCGAQTLVAHRGNPVEFYWLGAAGPG